MKKIITIIAACISLFSCTKTSDSSTINNSTFSLDPDIYFKVTFNGKTLSSNGVLVNGNPTDLNLALISTTTNNGILSTSLFLISDGSSFNNVAHIYNLTPLQTCNAEIHLQKNGNSIGLYTVIFGSITDITVGNKRYDIDIGSAFTVTVADVKYVKGTFVCNLIDGTTKIPATGSFSLKKL